MLLPGSGLAAPLTVGKLIHASAMLTSATCWWVRSGLKRTPACAQTRISTRPVIFHCTCVKGFFAQNYSHIRTYDCQLACKHHKVQPEVPHNNNNNNSNNNNNNNNTYFVPCLCFFLFWAETPLSVCPHIQQGVCHSYLAFHLALLQAEALLTFFSHIRLANPTHTHTHSLSLLFALVTRSTDPATKFISRSHLANIPPILHVVMLQAEALLPVFSHILSFSREEERACKVNLERLKQGGSLCMHTPAQLTDEHTLIAGEDKYTHGCA
eukprot:scaffold50191_cov15-Tisochrysis_lutea.AAC.1